MQSEPTWDDLRFLLAVHRHRSFLAAGQALGVATSTAARRIAALEDALSRPLVSRNNSGAHVVDDAMDLVRLAQQLELGLQALRRDRQEEVLMGTIRLSLGEGFVRPVTTLVSDLRRKHPHLAFEVVAENRMVDLAKREADLAIRKARSASAVLIERFVGRLKFALYASHEYIARKVRGTKVSVRELKHHDLIGFDTGQDKLAPAHWLNHHGAKTFVFRSNSDMARQEAAECGQGLCLLAKAQGRHVQGLTEIAVDDDLPSLPIYLVFHRELKNAPRFRLVIRALDAALRQGLSE